MLMLVQMRALQDKLSYRAGTGVLRTMPSASVRCWHHEIDQVLVLAQVRVHKLFQSKQSYVSKSNACTVGQASAQQWLPVYPLLAQRANDSTKTC